MHADGAKEQGEKESQGMCVQFVAKDRAHDV